MNTINTQNVTFRGARMNLLATADNHGNIFKMPIWLKTVENNAKDIFVKAGESNTRNFLAVVGDWFINPSKKGFITKPHLTNGELQNLALQQTIAATRAIVTKVAQRSPYFETLFTPGNHCLDAGDAFILDVMKKNAMTSVITNVDLKKSDAVVRAMEESRNIVKSAIYSIPDDKNPKLLHKVLFLSATIPSMDFYNPGLLKEMEFYDNCNKKDTNLKEEHIQGTINAIKTEVDKFKAENPKGAVILMSHMGGPLSEIVCKNVPQINQVLNGHDHKNVQTNVGKTSINSLGKDNEMIKALNLEFDDNGNLIKSTMTPYFTETTVADGIENHPFQKFLESYLVKDMQPIINLNEVKKDIIEGEEVAINPEMVNDFFKSLGVEDPEQIKVLYGKEKFKTFVDESITKQLEDSFNIDRGIKELSYGNEIRYSNSYLMNYLTSAIKRTIRENLDPDVFTVAIQSSIVRNGIKDGATNLDLMKVFDGVSEDLSNLRIGNVKGEELVGLITENILSNLKAPTRNTIIQWSDVQVNRGLIADISAGNDSHSYVNAIKVRNPQTKEFEPINLEKDYRMVIGEKFLVKDDIEWPGKIRDKFVSLDVTYDQLFKQYLASIDYDVKITPKTKEERIIG